MNKSNILVATTVSALMLSGPALADTFSYNMVDLKLIGTSTDLGDGDYDLKGAGIGASGSWEFSQHVFGYAGISGVEYSYDDEELGTALQSSVGIGFNVPLGSRVDFLAGASYERAGILEEEGDDLYEDDGYGLKVGVRGLAGERFEWHAGVNYQDIGGNGETTFGAGFRVRFSRLFGMGLDLSSSDSHGVSTGTAAIGFRFQFGDRD